ncbi:MAG TPA: hypothetical protein VK031_08725 [Tissierellaceae bacterium]|nr:hypothetical protein [Tissierellaceae bacterium]
MNIEKELAQKLREVLFDCRSFFNQYRNLDGPNRKLKIQIKIEDTIERLDMEISRSKRNSKYGNSNSTMGFNYSYKHSNRALNHYSRYKK